MFGGQFNRGVGYNMARSEWNYQNQQRISPLQGAQTVGKCMEKSPLPLCVEPKNKAENHECVMLPLITTNVERFLKATMPSVPALYISETPMRGWRTCNVAYFLLADLWESYKEWSAYGAAVPLLLNDGEFVVQYYVPYLSAMQIYVDPSKSPANLRRESQENGGKCIVKDSSSEGTSSDSKVLSMKDQKTVVREGLTNDEGGAVNSQVNLMFEFIEYDTPYTRRPLYTKISDLALRFPVLKNLRSCDILSSSWVSVAWYPIYRIPTGPLMKDLDACFLTYHSLHTPLGVTTSVQAPVLTHPNGINGGPKFRLPSFGLSTYKYQEYMWASSGSNGHRLVKSLSDAAYNWLTMLRVHHPDFNFFVSRR